MKSMALLILSFVALVVSVSSGEKACGENEYIPECLPCPPTHCGEPRNVGCLPKCIKNEECQCKPGYLRDLKGQCITEAECEKCTGVNEKYYPCGYCGSDACGRPSECAHSCGYGHCACKFGYLRKHGVCIPENEC